MPLELYWKNGKAKLRIGLAKGKKEHDKRATEKDRDWQREKSRLMKHTARSAADRCWAPERVVGRTAGPHEPRACRMLLALFPLCPYTTSASWGRPASTWVAKLQVHAEL